MLLSQRLSNLAETLTSYQNEINDQVVKLEAAAANQSPWTARTHRLKIMVLLNQMRFEATTALTSSHKDALESAEAAVAARENTISKPIEVHVQSQYKKRGRSIKKKGPK